MPDKAKPKLTTADKLPARFELYSKNGLKLGEAETQVRGEQLLGVWHNAKFLVSVASNGDRVCLSERRELV